MVGQHRKQPSVAPVSDIDGTSERVSTDSENSPGLFRSLEGVGNIVRRSAVVSSLCVANDARTSVS